MRRDFVRSSSTSMMVLVSPSTVAALTAAKAPTTIYSRVAAGKYGRVIRHGRTPYVAISGVEAFHNVKFTQAQLELATAGKLDRLLVIHQEE